MRCFNIAVLVLAPALLMAPPRPAGSAVEAQRPRRPQEPTRPFPYDDEEVTYENKRDGVRFAGTLTLPRSRGPFPAALLITGSGQRDRDETLKTHKPFLVLADHLTRQGVAVLRVDDREKGGTTGSAAKMTSADFADDVLYGLEYLKKRKEVHPNWIGLMGHSEGGLIGPIAATKSKDVAFVVMIAGPGIPGDEVLYYQDALLSRGKGSSDETIARYRRMQRRVYEVIKSEPKDDAAEKQVRALVAEELKAFSAEEKAKLESALLRGDFGRNHCQVLSPWFRFFLSHDPRKTLATVRCPVLALFGENDLFVPPHPHREAVDKALRAGGNTLSSSVVFPGLNHMLQTNRTENYARVEETMAPVALKTMSDWVLKQTVQRKR